MNAITTVTGIESRVPAEDYFALPGISITRLKELRRSPQHYKYALENPKESAPLTLGKAAHCAVLEPERFSREHAVWTQRTASGRMSPRTGKWWDAFEAAHAGQTIITADEYAEVLAMTLAVRGDDTAMKYLANGDPEVTLQWTLWGRQCRGRVDWLTKIDGKPVIVGLKTARDCRPFLFGNQAARMGYHLQWSFYFDGYEGITGDKPSVVEIVVESAPPHAVVVYVIPEEIIEQGRDEYMVLLEQLGNCERDDFWPGPAVEEQILTLPTWVYQAHDDISELGLEA